MKTIPVWLSTLALVVVTALGGGYLLVGVLQQNPLIESNEITVDMSASGGLRSGSEVTYRGVNIGRVTDVSSIAGGARIRLEYDNKYRIPAASQMKVENLSLIGEPVFQFNPTSNAGPALSDGQHVRTSTVELPTSVPQLLASTSKLLGQIDPRIVNSLMNEFTRTLVGVNDVIPTIRRGSELLATTIIRHRPSIDTTLRNAIKIMNDVSWLPSSMQTFVPALQRLGTTINDAFTILFTNAQKLNGGTLLASWRPTEQKLLKYFQMVSPDLGAIGEALRPIAVASGPMMGLVDFGTLIDQMLKGLPGDRVRVEVTIPK